MERFSLDEYLKNQPKKVMTRDGRPARIICTDRKGGNYPIVALIEMEWGEDTCFYSKNGKTCYDDNYGSRDLVFVPEKWEEINERAGEKMQEEKLVVNPWAVKNAFLKCGREGKVINEMYGNEFDSISPNRVKYLSFLKKVELDNRLDELNEILNKYGNNRIQKRDKMP